MRARSVRFFPILLLLAVARQASADPPLATVLVASGLAKPVYAASPPGDTSRIFILELDTGRVMILKNGALLPTPFMTQSGVRTGTKGGLIGLAFHPNYATNGYFYLHYSRVDGQDVLRRYERSAGNEDLADTTTGVNLMTVPDPLNFHPGGWFGFGPDGYLYIAKGDAGDQSYAQSDTTRSGKVLRIDVDGAFPYAIPPSNPFFGATSPKNEFWCTGLRNPWRCSFDRETHDLYIGDVGDHTWEELDYQPATSVGGENYGWPKFEGYAIFDCPTPCDSSGLTRPVAVFGHWPLPPFFCAIVGGYVYRGAAMPSLRGTYFCADFCVGFIYSLKIVNGQATALTDRTAELAPGGGLTIDLPTSFGEDANGEMYICDMADGEVYKIVADPTGVGGPDPEIAAGSLLGAPSPNPSRGGVRFQVRMPEGGSAHVAVFDPAGRAVRTIIARVLTRGVHPLGWDGRDARGAAAPPGVYFLRLEAAGTEETRKLTLVR